VPETLRVFGDRPATIVFEGWTVFIGVHDANHVRERSAWKQRLAHAHPDRHPEATTRHLKTRQERKFHNLRARQAIWLRREMAYYDQFHLDPPPFGRVPASSPVTAGSWHPPHSKAVTQRLMALFSTGASYTRAELSAALDARPNTVSNALNRLVARGALIHRSKVGRVVTYTMGQSAA
jgi:hypothetical protein